MDATRDILESAVNAAVDELNKFERGDPAHIKASAALKLARKDLEDYLKSSKKRR